MMDTSIQEDIMRRSVTDIVLGSVAIGTSPWWQSIIFRKAAP